MSNIGLVLVKTRDPLGRLVQTISKSCSYSSIGFYIDNEVYLVDRLDGSVPLWLEEETMEDIVSSIHVERVIVSKFTSEVDLSIIRNWQIPDIDRREAVEGILMLSNNNPIYYVNKLLMLLFSVDKTEDLDKYISKTVIEKGSMEDSLIVNSGELTDENRETMLGLYLMNFPDMLEPIEVSLNQNSYKSKEVIRSLGARFQAYVATLTHMLSRDDNQMLTKLIDRLKDKQVESTDLIDNVNNVASNAYRLAILINQGMIDGCIKYEEYLSSMIGLSVQINKTIKSTHTLSITDPDSRLAPRMPKLKLLDRTKLLTINVNDREQIDSREFSGSVMTLRNIATQIKQSVEDNTDIVVDINGLLRGINKLCQITGTNDTIEPLSGEYSTPAAVIVTEKEYVPVVFKTTTKVGDRYLTTQKSSVEHLDDNELKAVLNNLDRFRTDESNQGQAELDDFYSLRQAIVKKLGEKM